MPQPRGKRSQASQQLRATRQYIFSSSYRDYELAETIATVETVLPVKMYNKKTDSFYWVATQINKGDVLLDNRGRGWIQTIYDPKYVEKTSR